MRKVLSLEENYDFFSAKMVEDIVILNLKENILLQATNLTAKYSLLEYLELVSKNNAIKVVLIIGSPQKRGREEYILRGLVLWIRLCPGTAFPENSWESRQEKTGPISIVNQSPIQLLFLQPIPDSADTLPKGHSSIKLNTTITNTLLSQKSVHYTTSVDMETIRTSLEVSYGVTPCLELGLSLPVAHYYSGFMDKPVREVERMFGKIRKVRQEEDANEFV